MAAPQRIKGQEVTVLVIRADQLEDTLTNVVDFSVEPKVELKEQGYLGEKSNRYDEVFNGAKFNITLHLHTQAWLAFQNAIIQRAQRITPDVVFNITAVMEFPNGDTPSVVLNDVFFGAQPMDIKGRGDYVAVKLEGACSEWSAA